MDPEQRLALDDVKTTVRESISELKGLCAGISSALTAHSEKSAARWAEVDQRSRSAHERMDEHVETHRSQASSMTATWVAIATSLLAVGVSIAIALLSRRSL